MSIISIFSKKKKDEEFINKYQDEYTKLQEKWELRAQKYRLSNSYACIDTFMGDELLQDYYMVKDNTIYELPHLLPFSHYLSLKIEPPKDFNEIKTPIDIIEYFELSGSQGKQQIISGGDSKGVSVKGAIIGGVVAGDVGAIIGSQAKTNEIKTTYENYDDRKCVLHLLQDIKREKPYQLYILLTKTIPEKELENYLKTKKSI